MSDTKGLFEVLKGNIRQSGIFVAFVAIVGLFSVLSPTFLSPSNINNIVQQYSYVFILTIGMLFVIVLGQIDLSVGSVVAVTGAIAGLLIIKNGVPWHIGILAAIGVGILIGAWQGFWVAYVGIPGFIVTLAGMLLFRGLTFVVTGNVSLSPFPNEYKAIGQGHLNGLLGGQGYDVFTLLIFGLAVVGFAVQQWRSRMARLSYNQPVEALWLFAIKILAIGVVIMAFAYQLAHERGLPIVLILLALLVLVYGTLSNSTVFGRNVYAIGGNKAAAALSGINVKAVTFWTYVNIGLLSGIAGVVYSSRMSAAQPGAGNMFELDAIAACFIGGASTTGGVGRISGALIGGLIMAVLSNGMQLLGADTATQQMVKGMVLLLAVAFDVWNKRRAGGQ
ncbi:MAG: sugar ABC transporter permease [Actinomycetaceae bacterium]|nr:sugar ABC transporter permease [Actinomycetaceae bacterium]